MISSNEIAYGFLIVFGYCLLGSLISGTVIANFQKKITKDEDPVSYKIWITVYTLGVFIGVVILLINTLKRYLNL